MMMRVSRSTFGLFFLTIAFSYGPLVAQKTGKLEKEPDLNIAKVKQLLKSKDAADLKLACNKIAKSPGVAIQLLSELRAATNLPATSESIKLKRRLQRMYGLVLSKTDRATLKTQLGHPGDHGYSLVNEIMTRYRGKNLSLPTQVLRPQQAYDLLLLVSDNNDYTTLATIENLRFLRRTHPELKVCHTEVDRLFKMLSDDKIIFQRTQRSRQSVAIDSLVKIVPDIRQRLIQGLDHQDPTHRAAVINVFTRSASIDESLNRRLFEIAKQDESKKVARAIIFALPYSDFLRDENATWMNAKLKQTLGTDLESDKLQVLWGTILGLSTMTPKASQHVRVESANILMEAIETKLPKEFNRDPKRHQNSASLALADTLAAMPQETTKAWVKKLLPKLDDRDVQEFYLLVFSRIGHRASAAADKIRSLIAAEENLDTRLLLADRLWDVQQDSETVVPLMKGALLSRSSERHEEGLDLVEKLGPKAAPAVPILLGKLRQSNYLSVEKCLWSIGRLGVAAKPLLPHIAKHIGSDKRLEFEREALMCIEDLGPVAASISKSLIPVLQRTGRQNRSFRIRAARTVKAIGPGAADVIPALEKLAQSSSGIEIKNAKLALAAIRRE